MSTTGRMDILAENSSVQSSSMDNRRTIYDRVQSIAKEFDIEVKICACKNPIWPKVPAASPGNGSS